MRFLFNRRGDPIANDLNGELHAPTVVHVGHYLGDQGILVDRDGRYLGEVLYQNRLVFNNQSRFRDSQFGNFSYRGHAGSFGNPGNRGAVPLPSAYEDVDGNRLT